MKEISDQEMISCTSLNMKPCCYCIYSEHPPNPKNCLIEKIRISIKYYGFKPFLAKCKPLIDFAGNDVMRYLVKCVKEYYPEEVDKLESLLVLL